MENLNDENQKEIFRKYLISLSEKYQNFMKKFNININNSELN